MADPHGLNKYPATARRANLDRANAQKAVIKKLRADLKDRTLDGYALIAGDGGELENAVRKMKIGKLLLWLPGVGRVTRDELLAELNIPSDTRLYALTYERRKAIATLLKAVLEPESSTDLQVPAT